MLQLKNIKKDYQVSDVTIHALKGLDLEFRDKEFVSILGPSGCGKTTLLNLMGGLDRYTSGDLIINNRSTKDYNDHDWDIYRNHSVGFVFQSYNLIPHQTVLSNVELALTLSGISKAERRERATAMLEKVGLGDQLHKKPSQMSGGQQQRVSIARALINDPEILLADEPTGALDSETSVQIMNLLKEVAENRLVIMVTHNAELAEQYSSRIIKLLDGRITSDSNPYTREDKKAEKRERRKRTRRDKTASMSPGTAIGLSTNNLMTKKTRTFLTAFAGSIGIIGISLILSLSNGMQDYIDQIQEETLSSYPITVEQTATDISSLMSSMTGMIGGEIDHELDRVYTNEIMSGMFSTMMEGREYNNLTAFKGYLEDNMDELDEYISGVSYTYPINLNVYATDTEEITRVYPIALMESMMSTDMGDMSSMMGSSMGSAMDIWTEMQDNQELLESQYDVLAGQWPESYDEVVLIVDENNEITDYSMYGLGLKDQAELEEMMRAAMSVDVEFEGTTVDFTYDDLLELTYKLVLSADYYEKVGDTWVDRSDDEDYMAQVLEDALEVSVVGIIRPAEDSVISSVGGAVGYSVGLTEYIVNATNDAEIVQEQLANPDIDVFTGLPFEDDEEENEDEEDEDNETDPVAEGAEPDGGDGEAGLSEEEQAYLDSLSEEELEALQADQTGEAVTDGETPDLSTLPEEELEAYMATLSEEERAALTAGQAEAADMGDIDLSELSDEDLAYLETLTEEERAALMAAYSGDSGIRTYDSNLSTLGIADFDSPTAINIYPVDFESKDQVEEFIAAYNDQVEGEADVITYTDYVGAMMSSVTSIINIISYVLIAFVSISLVVSSIMIGIITYVSVLERTKEIGILKSIGASKRDISLVFNAETLIEGFVAGALGIGVTLLLNIPINLIIGRVTGISTIAALPVWGGVGLIILSMALSFIAGLIPSRIAANKDPVEAIRSE